MPRLVAACSQSEVYGTASRLLSRRHLDIAEAARDATQEAHAAVALLSPEFRPGARRVSDAPGPWRQITFRPARPGGDACETVQGRAPDHFVTGPECALHVTDGLRKKQLLGSVSSRPFGFMILCPSVAAEQRSCMRQELGVKIRV